MGISTVVVGGGIGGLSLARELSVRGLPVIVLEKAPRIVPVGAGMWGMVTVPATDAGTPCYLRFAVASSSVSEGSPVRK